MPSLTGRIILNQFRVDDHIASGGMGAVYKVWDLKRNTTLAMKVLHTDLADDPAVFKRFQREAQALQELKHPNIVPFYGLYQDQGATFLLEAFISGPSLQDILRQNKALPLNEVLVYMKGLCAALGYAHSRNIVHCDVKPGNVMVSRHGDIYLADFGIARFTGATTTTTMGVAGTPAYMAPEQIVGRDITSLTDIYALGVLLFEMLTGQRPFRGTEPETEAGGSTLSERIRYGHLRVPPPDPRKINSNISPVLAKVVLRALAKNPAERFRSAQEFFNALCYAAQRQPEQVSDETTIIGKYIEPPYTPIPPVSNTPRPKPLRIQRQRNLALVFMFGVVVIALSVFGAAMIISKSFSTSSPQYPMTHPPLITPTFTFTASTAIIQIQTATLAPTFTPAPKPTSTVTPLPSFSVQDANSWKGDDPICPTCSIDGWTDQTKSPGNYHWDVDFSFGSPASIYLAWCAVDKSTLDQNFQYMSYELIIDGYPIDLDNLTFEEEEKSDRVCYGYAGVLTDWSEGEHSYIWIHHIQQTIDDGWDSYTAGDYIFDFTVNVK